MLKITFATTCKNRAHHLKQTLIANMEGNPSTPDLKVEFVVLNYSSQDDLHKWIITNKYTRQAMREGRLRYLKVDGMNFWRIGHAKNIAHRFSSGGPNDIGVTVDADNLIGEDYALFVADAFNRNSNIILIPEPHIKSAAKNGYGHCGRVAVLNKHFMELGGYDERYEAYGNDDANFKIRAQSYGLKALIYDDEQYLQTIPHDNYSRVKHVQDPEEAFKWFENSRKAPSMYKRVRDVVGAWVTPVQANWGNFGVCKYTTFRPNNLKPKEGIIKPVWEKPYLKFYPRAVRGWECIERFRDQGTPWPDIATDFVYDIS